MLRNGFNRPLNRTDIPWLLEKAYDGKNELGKPMGGLRRDIQLSAFKTVGLVSYTMVPLFDHNVRATIGKDNVTATLQLDPEKIQPFVNDGDLDSAGDELVKQLMGSKFSTGRLQNFCLTDAAFRMCARVKNHVEDTNAKTIIERSIRSKTKARDKTHAKLLDSTQRIQETTSFKLCMSHCAAETECPCAGGLQMA